MGVLVESCSLKLVNCLSVGKFTDFVVKVGDGAASDFELFFSAASMDLPEIQPGVLVFKGFLRFSPCVFGFAIEFSSVDDGCDLLLSRGGVWSINVLLNLLNDLQGSWGGWVDLIHPGVFEDRKVFQVLVLRLFKGNADLSVFARPLVCKCESALYCE